MTLAMAGTILTLSACGGDTLADTLDDVAAEVATPENDGDSGRHRGTGDTRVGPARGAGRGGGECRVLSVIHGVLP